ncbi:MAG: hypothetical protein JSV26_02630 [bacterium]|nr:MAG: hypothetical protein JSV26_02630 [bacterium]
MGETGKRKLRSTGKKWFALGLMLALSVPSPSPAADTVGMILPRDCAVSADAKDKFVQMLFARDIPSGNVEVFVQRPAPDRVSRLNSARKFLSFGVAAIVIWGGTAVEEILRESGRTPVVFVGVYNPVKQGIVKDLRAPGKNTTGVASTTSLSFLLDNILEVVDDGVLGVVYHSDITDSVVQFEELTSLAGAKGLKILSVDVLGSDPAGISEVLAPAPFLYLAQGCYVEDGSFVNMEKLGKPAATQTPGITGGGVVFSLAPDIDEMLNEAAGITARILKGEKAGDIEVVRMKKIDFVINMGEARAMELKVPFAVLNRATKVIK